jgi:hypothetical protein
MECLWHFTANYAPDGSLAKFTPDEIAEAVTWTDSPEKLIAALKNGWIDEDLFVHDWPVHCEDATHIKLARAGIRFACGCTPKIARLNNKERPKDLVRVVCARHTHVVRTLCALPTPLPLPLPTPTTHRAIENDDTLAEQLYEVYPRKIARKPSIAEIKKALKKVPFEELKAKVDAYAKSVIGKEQKYIPHARTWFSQERWNDAADTSEHPYGKCPIPGEENQQLFDLMHGSR